MGRDRFAGGFLLGAVFGGALGGLLGATLANRAQSRPRTRRPDAAEAPGYAPELRIEEARRGLEERISQLNDAIDMVQQQVRDVQTLTEPEALSEEIGG